MICEMPNCCEPVVAQADVCGAMRHVCDKHAQLFPEPENNLLDETIALVRRLEEQEHDDAGSPLHVECLRRYREVECDFPVTLRRAIDNVLSLGARHWDVPPLPPDKPF